jgi:hypothetical protein
MSLKAFHLVFIVASVLLSVGFGVWGIREYAQGGPRSDLVMGLISIVFGVGLIVYGRYFLKKLRNISYL